MISCRARVERRQDGRGGGGRGGRRGERDVEESGAGIHSPAPNGCKREDVSAPWSYLFMCIKVTGGAQRVRRTYCREARS